VTTCGGSSGATVDASANSAPGDGGGTVSGH
jgi:hypothetical protein